MFYLFVFPLKKMKWSGWRNDSALSSTCCSSRVPEFWFLASMLSDLKQQPVAPARGHLGTSFSLCWYLHTHV